MIFILAVPLEPYYKKSKLSNFLSTWRPTHTAPKESSRPARNRA
jgi:hypothetical protein